MGNSNQGEP
ncbi:hypothetical protein YPPY91_4480, partial [Yersinia pestis PY-91]